MAKMTVQDVTYEGTPEELREIIATFEAKPVEATETQAPEPEAKPKYKTEKRHAKAGERILITDAGATFGDYANGDVLTVSGDYDESHKPSVEVTNENFAHIYDEEYEVIVEPTQAKPKPSDKLSHNGAEYSLVQRKAQPGDVVVATENNNRYFTNGKADGPVNASGHIVDNDGDTLNVYSPSNGRTEANVLVYEKVAVEAPKRFPQYGDIVRVTSDHYHNGFTEGAIGIVADADGTFSPEIKVCGKRGYARVEIVAEAESRADMR